MRYSIPDKKSSPACFRVNEPHAPELLPVRQFLWRTSESCGALPLPRSCPPRPPTTPVVESKRFPKPHAECAEISAAGKCDLLLPEVPRDACDTPHSETCAVRAVVDNLPGWEYPR